MSCIGLARCVFKSGLGTSLFHTATAYETGIPLAACCRREGCRINSDMNAYRMAGTIFQNAVVPNGLGSITHSPMELGL